MFDIDYGLCQAAVQYMKRTYGDAFLINYSACTKQRLAFDQVGKGTRCLRRYLPLPNWDIATNLVEIDRRTGTEITIFEDINIIEKDKAVRLANENKEDN